MSIIFFGSPEFAIPSLERLLKTEKIYLVITQPDKPAGRKRILTPPPVKTFAKKRGLEVVQPTTLKDPEFLKKIKGLSPDFIVVVAYGKILPKDILEITRCINLHASLLPKYRGAAPIQWAIIKGERKTGVTTILMDEGLDTGDILLQREVEIREDDTAETLSQRLAEVGAELLVETLRGLRGGRIKPRPQVGDPSYAPPLKKEDGLINWKLPAIQIRNLVRGLYPWPTAYTLFNGKVFKILKADVVEGKGEPGEIVRVTQNELFIGTGEGLLKPLVCQLEGKRAMNIEDFLRGAGRNLEEGMRLG